MTEPQEVIYLIGGPADGRIIRKPIGSTTYPIEPAETTAFPIGAELALSEDPADAPVGGDKLTYAYSGHDDTEGRRIFVFRPTHPG